MEDFTEMEDENDEAAEESVKLNQTKKMIVDEGHVDEDKDNRKESIPEFLLILS